MPSLSLLDPLIRSRDSSHHHALRISFGLGISMAVLLGLTALLPLPSIDNALNASLHTALEAFSIIVASMIFAVGWETHRRNAAGHLLLAACLFLGVALLDLSHALTFAGVASFLVPATIDSSIDFWLAARLLAALALLWIALVPRDRMDVSAHPRKILFGVLGFTAALHALLRYFPELIPATFYPHSGLTAFKIGSEYFIIGLNLIAAVALWRSMRAPLPFNAAALLGAVCSMALTGLCMTFYETTHDAVALLGHLFKVVSYLFLFRAIFIETIDRPFAALLASQQRLQAIFDALPDILVEVNKTGKIMEFHAPHSDELDLSKRQMVGREMVPLLPPEAIPICERTFIEAKQKGHAQSEPFRSKIGGKTIWFQISAAPKRGTDGNHYLVVARDVTKTKEQESEILRLSQLDSITSLPIRKLFVQRTETTLRLTARNKGNLAILQINLDNFKDINQTFGHPAGDKLLGALAERLRVALREEDILSRQTGDQFILTLPGLDSVAAAHVADRLCRSITRPVTFGEHTGRLTASIGIAIYPEDGTSLDELAGRATEALQLAKQDGGNTYRFLGKDLQARMSRILRLEHLLREAQEHLELSLRYQPQWELGTHRLIGLQSSLRWFNSELGEISEAEFLPIAEASGQSLALNDWVLQQALAQLKRWQDEGLEPVPVVVSLHAAKFRLETLPARIGKFLDAWSIEPRYLQLEVSEGLAMDDPSISLPRLEQIRELGVSIIIKDFGDSYASLGQVKKLKPGKLKIAPSFIDSENAGSDGEIILKGLIRTAHDLGLETMAECVDTPEQAELVRRSGCYYAQGNELSPPLTPEEVSGLLTGTPVE